MAIEIQGDDIIVRVRASGESTWLTFNCELDNSVEFSNDVTETDTKCGTFYGIKEMKGNITGNAVHNAVPGVSEASYEQVLTWQKAKTPVDMLIENEAFVATDGSNVAEGAAVHVFMEGKYVQTTLTSPTGEVVKFAWTFKPTTINLTGTSS